MSTKGKNTRTPTRKADDSRGTVKTEVYRAALHGDRRRLDALIRKRGDVNVAELLGHVTRQGQQRLTPLIGAACHGHVTVVELLLDKYGVDIEQTGTVVVENVSYSGVTALWCSVALGYSDVTRCLVAHGADVNHGTVCNTSPLHAVFSDEQLDLVRFLVEQGADFTASAKKGTTCFMRYCKDGLRNVVRFLMERKVDLSRQNKTGRTALHFAAGGGRLTIVKDLLKAGTGFQKDACNMSPLTLAAASGQADVVEYLVGLDDVTQAEEADSLELLGATLALDLSLLDGPNLGHKYLEQGLQTRCRGTHHVPKPHYKPVPAYGDSKESMTMAELRGKPPESSAFLGECLTARERILGPDNPEVASMLVRRASHLADDGCFQDALGLQLHAAELQSRRTLDDSSVKGMATGLASVFCKMVQAGCQVRFEDFERGIKNAISAAVRRSEKSLTPSAEVRWYREDVTAALTLIDLALPAVRNDEDVCRIQELAQNLVVQDRRAGMPFTSLHVAIETLSKKKTTAREATPDTKLCLISLLLTSGGQANGLDAEGRRPLHLLGERAAMFSDASVLHEAIWSLVRGGAHVDARNREGKTPVEVASSDDAREVLESLFPLSLKCLAANAVVLNGVSYRRTVPTLVEAFIDLHRPQESVPRTSGVQQ